MVLLEEIAPGALEAYEQFTKRKLNVQANRQVVHIRIFGYGPREADQFRREKYCRNYSVHQGKQLC